MTDHITEMNGTVTGIFIKSYSGHTLAWLWCMSSGWRK